MKSTLIFYICAFSGWKTNAKITTDIIRPQLPPGWWENKLQKKILSGYEKNIAPFSHQMMEDGIESPIVVNFAMVLQRLLTIKMREEEIVMAGYNVVDWTDDRLSWNPMDYKNISVTNINSQLIWKPGTVFYNNKDGSFETKFKTKLKVMSNGYISWMPPALYKSTCSLNVKVFPFDRQKCSLIFRSTDFEKKYIDYNHTFAVGTSYVEGSNVSAEWVLLRTNIFIVDSSDSDLSFREIHFEYHFQRMPLFYILNMILPIWLMFFLSIFVFYLPTDACEKMTLSISILIGQTVFLTLLAKHTPETSMEIPLLSSYLLFTIMMVSFSVIMSVIVCNVHFRSSATHKLPRYFQVIFIDHIARYLNIKRPPPFEIDMPRRNSHGEDTKTTSMCYELELEEDAGKAVASEIMFNTHSKLFGCSDRKAMSSSVRNTTRPLARELRPAVEAIDFITTTMQQNDDESTVSDEWRYIALIIDSLLLYVYCFVAVVGSIYYFWSINYAAIFWLQSCASSGDWAACGDNNTNLIDFINNPL